jgi:Uma2 family endonuclease
MSERLSTMGSPRELVEGERLDQPTFHALYEAMPAGARAELINGVVLMPSPVGPAHSRAHVPTLVWLSYYQEKTPGVEALDNAPTALGLKSEPQPDALLRTLPEYGGRTRTDRRFVQGVPELVVEIAHTSRFTDLGPKFEDYERVGVLEYVVRAVEPDEVLWFVLRKGRLTDLAAGADGIYRSEVFPGLWLEPEALIKGDTRRLRAALDQGCATPEHAAFVARLLAARSAS